LISDKYKISGGYFTGIILIGLSVLILPLGIIGFFSSGFSYIGLIWLVFAISGGLLLYSGIASIRSASKTKKDEAILKAALDPESSGTEKEEIKATILADWKYDDETWEAFKQNEKSYRKEDNIYYFIGVVILGTIGLLIFRSANLFVAVAISAILGGIMVLLRSNLSLSKLKKTSGPYSQRAIIGEGYVLMNGHTFDLFDTGRYTSKVEFLPDENPPILEFTIKWMTRKGATFDELRVPVPNNKIEEAIQIVTHFKSKT